MTVEDRANILVQNLLTEKIKVNIIVKLLTPSPRSESKTIIVILHMRKICNLIKHRLILSIMITININ